MKSALKSALTAALRRTRYYAALFQLRALETNLCGMCDALPHITDIKTRADTRVAIQRLSLQVVEMRNKVRALSPNKPTQQHWKAA